MEARKVEPFGYEVSGVDLRSDVTDALIEQLRGLLNDQGFVLFRGQDLDASQQAAFARRFGPFSGHNDSDRKGFEARDGEAPTLRIYTNSEGIGRAPELGFHSDNAHAEHSLRYLTLYGIDFDTGGRPIEGGETLLASAAEAVDRLPVDLRRKLEGWECRISAQSMSSFVRPCIERHWATGRPYLVPSTLTEEILGLGPEETAAVCERIHAVMYDPAYVYRHAWRAGDLLLWDNRLLHHGRGWYDNSQTRTIRRCAIADELEPTALA